MRRILTLLLATAVSLQGAEGEGKNAKKDPQPIASLALSESPAYTQAQLGWVSVAFTSNTSIALGVCLRTYFAEKCSVILVRWENGLLQPFAQTQEFNSGTLLHAASDGRILGIRGLSPAVQYSADLSTARELPINLSRFSSPSGKTAAEWARGSWKLYRLTDKVELLREGTGNLQSLSDESVLIQDRKVMRVETLDGQRLGSFPMPPVADGYYASTGSLGNNKLYLDDCKSVRVVDFDGKTISEIHPRKGCSMGDTASSSDGSRILFDYTNRKVNGFRHIIENVQTVTTLGMIGPEDVNHEQVSVFDTASGKACFDWERSFPLTYSQVRSAAISPSGTFVAIVADDRLSMYSTNCNE